MIEMERFISNGFTFSKKDNGSVEKDLINSDFKFSEKKENTNASELTLFRQHQKRLKMHQQDLVAILRLKNQLKPVFV